MRRNERTVALPSRILNPTYRGRGTRFTSSRTIDSFRTSCRVPRKIERARGALCEPRKQYFPRLPLIRAFSPPLFLSLFPSSSLSHHPLSLSFSAHRSASFALAPFLSPPLPLSISTPFSFSLTSRHWQSDERFELFQFSRDEIQLRKRMRRPVVMYEKRSLVAFAVMPLQRFRTY